MGEHGRLHYGKTRVRIPVPRLDEGEGFKAEVEVEVEVEIEAMSRFAAGQQVRVRENTTSVYRGQSGPVIDRPVEGYDVRVELWDAKPSFLEGELEPVEPDEHVRVLEDAIEGILEAARSGNWEGPEIPEPVGAAIAFARLMRDAARRTRGMPPYDATEASETSDA